MKATLNSFYYPNELDQDYLDALSELNIEPNLINQRYPDPIQALFSDYGLIQKKNRTYDD